MKHILLSLLLLVHVASWAKSSAEIIEEKIKSIGYEITTVIERHSYKRNLAILNFESQS